MRILGRLVYALTCLLLVLLLVAGVLTLLTIRRSFPQVDGAVKVTGLHGKVEVYRDAYGVPQVYAADADDLFRGQGYVQAQDRFWEMDFRRHVTAGRLAEMFGRSQVDTDAYIRTMGWRDVAAREWPLLRPDARRYLTDYADGVNAWLRGKKASQISLEYAVLGLQNSGYRIEQWTPVDSLAWLKAMAWDLRSNMTEEIDRAVLSRSLTARQLAQLYPPYPYARNAPIVAGGGVTGGTFSPAPAPVRGAAVRSALLAVRAGLAAVPQLAGSDDRGIGSNSWVVAGTRTATGQPILSNDPHLSPVMPSIWYQMGLHCTTVSATCPYDVSGFTFSGLPGVVIGHNAHVAWGFTNLGPDVADLYLERVTGDTYEIDGTQHQLAVRTETIKVAGGEQVRIRVRSTNNGPLLSDRDSQLRRIGRSGGQSYGVALRWTALTPGRTADAIFELDRATNWQQFRTAAAAFEVPAQNLVYADTSGNIGYQAPGKIPIRDRGDGRFPAPGWDSRYDWKGYVPFAALPTELNPADGYIATANNAVTGPSYPYFLTDDWAYGYRSQRIADMITGAGHPLTVADMGRMQTDTYDTNAAELVPYLLRTRIPSAVQPARNLLRGWDFREPTSSAPAAYFNAVWRHLLARTFGDQLPTDERASGGGRWFEVVRSLLDHPDDPWWDDVRTSARESRDDMLRAAMVDADHELRGRLGFTPGHWRWGALHTLTVRNQSFGESGIGPVEWLFNGHPVGLGGGNGLIDATSYTADDGYAVQVAPSMRMVVDLGDLNRSRWVNLTGASGHSFTGHYTDQTALWASGQTTPMLASAADVRRTATHHLTLLPS